MLWKLSWKAALLTAAALGGMLVSSGNALARDNCRDRIRREEYKLERDIERHGYNSRQARHDRQRIRDLRARCGFGRGGWRDRDRDWDHDRR